MNIMICEPRQETAGDFLLEEKVKRRRLSLEDDFMNYSTDDLLFSAMLYLATFHPEAGKLYLTKKNYEKNRKNFYNLCDDTSNAKTLKRHLDKLIEKGLVAEENIKSGGEAYPSYVFPYDYNKKYQLVESEMLWYVVSTRNRQAVKVYIQLLNWYLWKKENNDVFVFTNKDIMKALGYSTDNKLASSAVSNILDSFAREGVVKIETYYESHIDDKGITTPTPKKRLLFVARSKNELPAVS